MDAYHWPPDLLELLVETIPVLCRSKDAVLNFFEGAGVDPRDFRPMKAELRKDREAVGKYQMARDVLTRANRRGDEAIRARREIIKRVVEFEDYSLCWQRDQLKAEGLVQKVRKMVGAKDTFTRMKHERDRERELRSQEYETQIQAKQRKRAEMERIRSELYALFSEKDVWKRGKALERVLNDLFRLAGISLLDAFTVRGNEGEGIIEQVDGLIALDGDCFVEIKWEADPVGVNEVGRHLCRLMLRDGARGLMISASGFTAAAAATCREALATRVAILCDLHEIVQVLDREGDLAALFRTKFTAAVGPRNPYYRPG
jgi:hypothetical protein